MREILFATALADDHRPNAYDNNMDGCFKLERYLEIRPKCTEHWKRTFLKYSSHYLRNTKQGKVEPQLLHNHHIITQNKEMRQIAE